MQTLALQMTDEDAGTGIASVARLRSDLNTWVRLAGVADSTTGFSITPTSLDAALAAYPCAIIQNTGANAVTATLKLTNGGSSISLPVPATDLAFLPQIDYGSVLTLKTASSTSACVIWLGYAT